MRILSRHFVSAYLTYYAGIVVGAMLVIAIIEMMVNFDHTIEYGQGIAGVASYLFLRLPSYYLPLLIPVGSFGAAFLSLGLAARSLEVLAAKASGISPLRLAAPVLVAASFGSALALLLNETIVLDTAKRFNRESSEGGEELFQSQGSFWFQRGDTLFSVQEADRDARTLRGVSIFERNRQGRLLRSVQADVAHMEGERRWKLENAIFREFREGAPEEAPRTESRETAFVEMGSAEELALLDADPRSLSLGRLTDFIAAREEEGRSTTRFRAMWHGRVADPFSVLVFALIGAPLGMAVEHTRSVARSALEGVALVGGYYALQTTAVVFGSGGIEASVYAPWVVLVAFLGIGLWRLARVGR